MKREPIKTPFLAKARDQDYTDSLMIFKMILRFMNENNLSGKREQALGDYIVNKGIVNEKLRDEILCQLANQTWKNENDANKERGWLLLSNCLSAFQPSSTLFKYLLKYVSDHAYDGYKAYCQRKLLQGERTIFRIMSNNQQIVHHVPRNYPPCVLEWRANRNRVNMALSVGFYDGEFFFFYLKFDIPSRIEFFVDQDCYFLYLIYIYFFNRKEISKVKIRSTFSAFISLTLSLNLLHLVSSCFLKFKRPFVPLTFSFPVQFRQISKLYVYILLFD